MKKQWKENWDLPPIVENDTPFEDRYPHEIGMQIMDICNLRCSHCYLEILDDDGVPWQMGKHAKGHMPIELFHKIANNLKDVLPHVKTVNFTAVEGLFHPHIWEIIDTLRGINPEIGIRIDSNGMLLNEKNILKLKERGNIDLGVSLDGCTKESVESFKTGVKFDRVIRNMKLLQKHDMSVRTIFVSHKDNIESMLDYVDFCADLGVESIKVNTLIPYEIKFSPFTLAGEKPIEYVDNIYKEAKLRAYNKGMDFFYRRTFVKPLGCGGASYTLQIDVDGSVSPCSWYSKPTPFSLFGKTTTTKQVIWGNAATEDIMELWTKKNCVGFRKILHNRILPKGCKGCPQGELGVT
jgi:MoaA/NifB/PqqE/SkfB family radical SAM enzyme